MRVVIVVLVAALASYAQTLDPLLPTLVSVTGSTLLQSALSPIELGLVNSRRKLQDVYAAGSADLPIATGKGSGNCGLVSSAAGATPYFGTSDGNTIARNYCVGTGQLPGTNLTRSLLAVAGSPLKFYGECKSAPGTNQAACNFIFDREALNALNLLKTSLGTDNFVAASVSLGDVVVSSTTAFTSRTHVPYQPVLVKVISSRLATTLPKINFWATYTSSAPGSTSPKYLYISDLVVTYGAVLP